VQSTLEPAGPAAAAIARSWWIMAAGALAILALVCGLAAWAVFHGAGRRAPSPRLLIVGGGVLLPVVVLTTLLIHGLQLMARAAPGPAALEVQVVARQWSWEVRYPAPAGGEQRVATGELRIPAGRPVLLRLSSPDVIHSFWVPRLAGKMDVIPGHERRLVIEASQPGRFRGQCAEFCGAGHAHMTLWVLALPPAEFDAWLAGGAGAEGR